MGKFYCGLIEILSELQQRSGLVIFWSSDWLWTHKFTRKNRYLSIKDWVSGWHWKE